jgi:hypothetical protein
VPLIAVTRQDHHPHWRERFTEHAPLKAGATPMESMRHRLATQVGRTAYAICKQTVEPVFGIIKSVMGFRQCSLRGLRKVTGEWNLVYLECQAHGRAASKSWMRAGNTVKIESKVSVFKADSGVVRFLKS